MIDSSLLWRSHEMVHEGMYVHKLLDWIKNNVLRKKELQSSLQGLSVCGLCKGEDVSKRMYIQNPLQSDNNLQMIILGLHFEHVPQNARLHKGLSQGTVLFHLTPSLYSQWHLRSLFSFTGSVSVSNAGFQTKEVAQKMVSTPVVLFNFFSCQVISLPFPFWLMLLLWTFFLSADGLIYQIWSANITEQLFEEREKEKNWTVFTENSLRNLGNICTLTFWKLALFEAGI